MADIESYKAELEHDVAVTAVALNQFTEDAFFEAMTDQMIDAGELETSNRVHFSKRGLQVDGYDGQLLENERCMSLLLLDYSNDPNIETLTATTLDAIFKRGRGFIDAVLEGKLRDAVEETSPAFDLVDLLSAHGKTLLKIRLCVITNRRLSSRIDGVREGVCAGIPVTHSVWDLERSFKYDSSRSEREDIEVDFEGEFGGPVPALPAHLEEADYKAYLAVIPGPQLAAVYDRWGSRLLEQNVRVFLQARGGVNKGIKATIERSPERFFAYNNGISATADGVTIANTASGTVITSIHNLQIVNGGQTTASIHAAAVRGEPGVDRVFVQMKLAIIEPAYVAEVVPKISEYANSQNKISSADFFSNHPFHVRMEELSRRIFAPPLEGELVGAKWFYERARGQYNDSKARVTGAQRRKFEEEFPKAQLFTKTDLAKVLNSWGELPHIVSRGAQKNFAAFAGMVSQVWEKSDTVFNEAYYKECIAKLIAFKHLERLVSRQEWYEGGYRANIVAYACAKLSHVATHNDLAINYERIWKEQRIGEPFEQAMACAAKAAYDVLLNTPSSTQNVTEWAKKDGPWHRLMDVQLRWPKAWIDSLQTREQATAATRAAARAQQVDDEINALQTVVEAGASFWSEVRAWGSARRILSITEDGVLKIASMMPNRIPTEKQCKVMIRALARLREEGFDGEMPTAKKR